jgi:hypothetical protein
LLLEAAWAGAG